jgi:cyanophycin synthetase
MQTYQSIELITQALVDRGFSSHKIRINNSDRRMLTKGQKVWITQRAYLWFPFVSYTLRLLSIQKNLTYDYVQSLGYTVPKTALYPTGHPVNLSESQFDYPVIVKPVDGSGSAGVTRGITDAQTLQATIEQMHQAGDNALVQTQFHGQEIRLTVLDGVVSACLRAVPQLLGDGVSTIAALLAAENQARQALVLPYITYPQLTAELVSLPENMDAVPKRGDVVKLGESTMISGGASVYPIDETLHASYRDMVLAIASSLHASFLVVDLLVTDYRQEATAANYIFLEFNTAPALKLYYSYRAGEAFDILPRLAQKIEASISSL